MIFKMKLSVEEVAAIHSCLGDLADNEHDKNADEGVAASWGESLQQKLMQQKEGGEFEFDEQDIAVMSYSCETWCMDDGELDDEEYAQQKATGRGVFERLKAVTFTIPEP